MPREYRRMLDYEDEILKMREEGKTKREICERFGFTMKQMTNFVTRLHSSQRKLAAGIASGIISALLNITVIVSLIFAIDIIFIVFGLLVPVVPKQAYESV